MTNPDGSEAGEPEFIELASTLEQLSMPMLTVTVDFNQLLDDRGPEFALDLIGKLKDLLT